MQRSAPAARVPAAPAPPARPPARQSHRLALLGVPAGHLIAWQLILIAALVALIERGPVREALAAVVVVGFLLTVSRWRHRWAYEWLRTGWDFRRGRAARPAGGSGPAAYAHHALPPIDVTPAKVRNGGDAGVAHDGDGFAVIIDLTPEPKARRTPELRLAALTSLLDPADGMVSSVQIIQQADLAAGATGSGPAAAYRSLRYARVPRSVSTWVVLRHDPAVTGFAVAAAGPARDAHNSLMRTLANRGPRALDLIADLPVRARLLDPPAVTELLARTLLAPETTPPGSGPRPAFGVPLAGPAADAATAGLQAPDGPRSAHRWGSWRSATRRHITFWVRRWPPEGLGALQQALAGVPALSVTTAVVVSRIGGGQIGLTATVRVSVSSAARPDAVSKAVTAAAHSCGARLVRMDGHHTAGVLATLPLGRAPGGHWQRWHAPRPDGSPRTGRDAKLAGPALTVTAPVIEGGVVIGVDGEHVPVAVPFFRGEGPTRSTIIGDALLPRLLALRVLGAGARLQVVTAHPGGWAKLREQAQVTSQRMTIVRPGTQPPGDATRADPWLILDDTGSAATAGTRPWQAVVSALSLTPGPGAVLPDPDALLIQRCSADTASLAAAALHLTGAAAEALHAIPDATVALARPGAPVRYAQLAPDPTERAVLTGSWQAA